MAAAADSSIVAGSHERMIPEVHILSSTNLEISCGIRMAILEAAILHMDLTFAAAYMEAS